ncbi:MAG: hypothetical protein Q9178_006688 [Gyalolechia marmorata]
MTLHHDKHHFAYVQNLNAVLKAQADTSSTRNESQEQELRAVFTFNASGHVNHSLFLESLAPPSSPKTKQSASPKSMAALAEKWGSTAAFKDEFRTGSGDLSIMSSRDQDIVPKGYKPLLGIDMWEQAYYLQYLNNKTGYVERIWEFVNWEVVGGRFLRSMEEVYGSLTDLKAAL